MWISTLEHMIFPTYSKFLEADYQHELIGERLTTTPKHYAYLKIAEGCDRPCSFLCDSIDAVSTNPPQSKKSL